MKGNPFKNEVFLTEKKVLGYFTRFSLCCNAEKNWKNDGLLYTRGFPATKTRINQNFNTRNYF